MENNTLFGFKLIRKEYIDDILCTYYQYEHIKSKGKVVFLINDDNNQAFTIMFKTLPTDSTGVAHIIEHSTLCGSNKYPLKEPFVNLLKTSLNTFLNAFTASDWTMYPFASPCKKDFDNILDIYLDAVFNPLSIKDPKPFLQEGWHYELNNINDIPTINGVVYNEMKGAYDDPNTCISDLTNRVVFKDIVYANDSGGKPEDIPNLTYKDYCDFYHKHYVPENSVAMFYGNINIEEKLEYLDKNYYSNYEAKGLTYKIEKQKPIINTSAIEEYAISEDDSLKDNSYINLCYVLDDYSNKKDQIALRLLFNSLMGKNDSPLTKAILDAKLGLDTTYDVNRDSNNATLTIYLQKTNKDKKEAFYNLFINEINKYVSGSIDKEQLKATINRAEFKYRERDIDGYGSKGIIYFMSLANAFNYDSDPIKEFDMGNFYKFYRDNLNTGYFEGLLKKYILDSKHYGMATLVPSKTLANKKKKALDEKLKKFNESLSLDEKKKLIEQTKKLKAYQNHKDTKKELKCLPKLTLKDISKDVAWLPYKKVNINGMKGITHTINSNGIVYYNMFFPLNMVSFDDLYYVRLLSNLLLNSKTKSHSVMELSTLIKTYLGEFYFALSNKTDINTNKTNLYLKCNISSLTSNIEYISKLFNEVIYETNFTKNETLRIVKQITNNIKKSLQNKGHSVAQVDQESSSFKNAAADKRLGISLESYNFFNNLVNNFNFAEVNKKLKELCKKIFNKKYIFYSISCQEKDLEIAIDEFKNINLKSKKYDDILEIKLTKKENRALIIPSDVSYNSIGIDYRKYDIDFNGDLLVLTHILNYDYMWPEIRVKGGAYGAFVSCDKLGALSFTTYRDPNVKNSYNVINSIGNYIRNLSLTKSDFTSYVIGSLAGIDSDKSNSSLIYASDNYYLTGVTLKDRKKTKYEMIHANYEHIKSYASLFDNIAYGAKSTIGNKEAIETYNFDKVDNL